jgi:quercetin dioxygenase-like cupin family protein
VSLPIIDETAIEELDLPGRQLRWVITSETAGAKFCSMAVIRVAPGAKVRPAHSHPNGEEIIYILNGYGRVLIDGEVGQVKAGSAVLFPQGKVHMLHNQSHEEMKVACFFAPATSLDNYAFFEDIDIPG